MTKQVLITGASGFVGANLARHLIYLGHDVHLIVRSNHTSWRINTMREHITLHSGNLANFTDVDRVWQSAKPDWVFHLAAHGAYSSQTNLDDIINTNFVGTANLARMAVKYGCESFVNAGSSSEYGFKDHAPSEDEYVDPNSDYAATKVAATQFLRHTALRHNLRMSTLRLYSVYGNYEEPTRLVPKLIEHGFKGEYPPLVNPDISRDYIYIEDVNDAFLLAAQHVNLKPGSVYNVGTGVQTSLRQIVTAVRTLMHIDREPTWGNMPNRMWDTNIWVANPTRIIAELGWQPKHNLTQGLAKTIDWFTQNNILRKGDN